LRGRGQRADGVEPTTLHAHGRARGGDGVGAFLRQRHVVNVDNACKRAALRAAGHG